ncbi:MAG: DUF3352 domain-containing protein [Chthonomonas sp.]|nr:DUF3352 domain-containing protein [Chthonomonas sp.]
MRTRQGKSLVIGLAATAGLAVAGGIAYKMLSDRKGESALQYVPADSVFVMSFDTAPSARQALTMQTIAKALEREGLDKKFDETVAGMLQGHPLANELRKNLATSYAMAVWLGPNKTPQMAGFFAVKDRGRVEDLVRKGAGEKAPITLNMMGDYLVVTDTQNTFQKILDVKEQKTPNILSVPGYKSCREVLPSDANLLVYSDYGKAAELAGAAANNNAMSELTAYSLGMSITIQGDGLALDVSTIPFKKDSMVAKMATEMKPINQTELNRIPAGSLGFLAYQGMGAFLTQYSEAVSAVVPDAKKMISEFETKSGLSLENDVKPLLAGTFSAGVYSSASGKPTDVDFFIRAEGDAGAATRVGAAIRKSASNREMAGSQAMTFAPIEVAGKPAWEGKGTSQPMIMSEYENGLTLASSKTMMESLVTGTKPLSGDASTTSFLSKQGNDDSFVVVFNHGRMLTRFEKQITESQGGRGPAFADILAAVGGESAAITMTSGKNGERMIGRLFIPLNYDKLIGLIGTAMREQESGRPSMSGEGMPTSPELK